MQMRLEEYAKKALSLKDLIDDLSALNDCLIGAENFDWRNEFEPAWSCLDEVYAFMVDEGRTEMTPEDCELVSASVKKLQVLVEREIVLLSSRRSKGDADT